MRRRIALGLGLWISLTLAARGLGPPLTVSAIGFEDRQPASGIDFVLHNGTTLDKPVIDAVLGGVALLDFDNDGRLNVFFTNGARIPGLVKDDPRFWNRLYRNEGAGAFRDVSEATGIGVHVGKGMSVAVADAEGDGFLDVFVTNDRLRNFLFRNVGGQTFVETGVEAGVAYTEDGVPVSGVGADFRDLDQAGRADIFLTALSGDTFPLYLNTAEGFFAPATHRAGLGFATVMMSGWGTGAYDLDNDGREDLFIANSHVSENVDSYAITATGSRTPCSEARRTAASAT